MAPEVLSYRESQLNTYLPLLRAAPKLRAIRGHAGVFDAEDFASWLILQNVKEVELQHSAISSGGLVGFLRACPALETFVFEYRSPTVGNEQFNPTQAKDAPMEHHGPNLKKGIVGHGRRGSRFR
ncbi:hypothetical protein B0T25DRAFT_537329 [Lasiosphaeria hispida]|uniref:F-box domain-containing protein n=1 Tax=Lasiosphaeria hispida TaxID=260671 RepID=A0AAJ0MFJ7_9PEZI|nr:hypothetical protein B0T25DRAFT_537329 [Lasiosphaeria hispida]